MNLYKMIFSLFFFALCLSPMMANVNSSLAYTLAPTEQVHTDPPQKEEPKPKKKKQTRAKRAASVGAAVSIATVIGIKVWNTVKFFAPDSDEGDRN